MLELMKWFESVESDTPFVTCKVCTHQMVFSESWVVNKPYHRDECVMEYAVCEECRDGYAISAQFRQDESLIEGALPLLMYSDCVAKITASLTLESREVWRDFVAQHFDGTGTDDIDLGIFYIPLKSSILACAVSFNSTMVGHGVGWFVFYSKQEMSKHRPIN